MKNATPSDIAIKNVLKDIDELISYAKVFIKDGHADAPVFLAENTTLARKFDKVLDALEQLKTLGYLTESQFSKIKTHFLIKDENVSDALLDVSTDYLNTNKGGHIADIVERIFPQTNDNLFIERMQFLKQSLEKCLTKAEKVKSLIAGLKQPIVWENITLLVDGDVEVVQDDKSLGSYSLNDLNFPVPRKKNGKEFRNVRGFFLMLFMSDRKVIAEVLNAQDNNNQKLKSSLTSILCEAFGTNKDPIKIVNNIYQPLFKAKFGGALRVNEHRSGGELFENQEY